MEELLHELLADLAAIAEQHKEINDTTVEEAMSDAIFHGFLKPSADYLAPATFGMFSPEADARLKAALDRYLQRANSLAKQLGLDFHGRLAAFQNREVTCGDAQLGYNDFFRYHPPKQYDDQGNPK